MADSHVHSTPSVQKVAVVGAGLLGTRIAGELALQGCTVHVYDHDPLTVQTIHTTISAQIQDLKDRGLLQSDHQIKGRVIADSLLSSAVLDADIVFETVIEDIDVKKSIFNDIASVCSRDVILCTSTLSLPLQDVFNNTPYKERTLGVRFLFPVYLINSVEVTSHDDTSKSALDQVDRFLNMFGKRTFQRPFGEHPTKLSDEEALIIQKQSTCTHTSFCSR